MAGVASNARPGPNASKTFASRARWWNHSRYNMAARKVRIGIVGLGFMAATHIRAYQKVAAAEIAALCSPSGRHLDGDFTTVAGNINTGDPLKLDVSNIKCLRNFEEMIAMPDLDLIDICTPTASHPALAIAALKAGKHVLCEKPMARTSAAAKEMVAAAKAAGRILMPDRKSTRLNSSHLVISYAVFCLKKKHEHT